jgi:hypothetical protein
MDSNIPINANQNKTRMGTYPTQSVVEEVIYISMAIEPKKALT